MKHIIFAVAVCYCAFMAGCVSKNSTKEHVHGPSCTEEHEVHNHEHHDHTGEKEDAHNHEHEHDHSHSHAAGAEHDHVHSAHEGHEHSEDEHSEVSHASDEIIFPAEQAARVDFEMSEVVPSDFSSVIKCSGEILSAQDDSSPLSAPVSGIVRFAVSPFADGSAVSAGRPVLYIDSKSVDGGDVSAKASAAYKTAEAQLRRAQALLEDKIISQKEYEAAQSEYAAAKSQWEAVGSSSDKGVAVNAPMNGYASGVAVSDGDFVQTGDLLLNVTKNNRMRLVASVPQRYYTALRGVKTANFVVSDGEVRKLSSLRGRRVASSVSAAASSPLVTVTFEFDAPQGVVQGSFADVYLLGEPKKGVISLPLGAVTEAQGHYFVFVQLDDEGYARREVAIGETDGERVEILSGLEAGQRVVTRGAVHVKMAAMTAIPHSHSH